LVISAHTEMDHPVKLLNHLSCIHVKLLKMSIF